MTIASVKEGDIVEVDKGGRLFFALVTDRRRGLAIKPLSSGITYRSASAREVVGHYRRSKGSRVPAAVAA